MAQKKKSGKGSAVTLTGHMVAAATANGKPQRFIYDHGTGLALRIVAGGGKTWVFAYSLAGKPFRKALRPALKSTDPEALAVDLAEARAIAAKWKAEVERGRHPGGATTTSSGTDGTAASTAEPPSTDDEKIPKPPKPTPDKATMQDLWDWLDYHQTIRRTSPGHRRNCRRAFEGSIFQRFPPSMLLSALRWPDVEDWYQGIVSQRKITKANHALAALQAAWRVATDHEFAPQTAKRNPVSRHNVEKPEQNGKPFSPELLARLGPVIEQEPNPMLRTALWVCALTGLRPDEVCNLRWSDFELTSNPGNGSAEHTPEQVLAAAWTGLVRIVDAKTKTRNALISSRVESLLRALPTLAAPDDMPYKYKLCQWVFPGRSKRDELPTRPIGGDGRTHGLKNVWETIQQLADLPRTNRVIYSFRHTFVVTGTKLNVNADLLRLLVGHAKSRSDAHMAYANIIPDDHRGHVDLIAEHIYSRMVGQQPTSASAAA